MYLDSKSADVKLIYDEGGSSFETWWLINEEVVALSYCPGNSPDIVIHTMSIEDSAEQLSQLVEEGWMLVNCSFNYGKHCTKKILSKLRD